MSTILYFSMARCSESGMDGKNTLMGAGIWFIFIFDWKRAALAARLSRSGPGIVAFAVGEQTSVPDRKLDLEDRLAPA